jgi:hypothetical protein
MAAAVTSTRSRGRIGAWMGIVFVVLFVVGFGVFSTPSSNNASHTAQWQHWWADSGHRTQAIIGTYLMVLGLLAFVAFLWALRSRLGDGGGLAKSFGMLFTGVALVGVMVRATIPGAKVFGSTPVPGSDFARLFDQIGFAVLLVAGALAAGLFVIVASHSARQGGALPGWLTIAGYIVGVLQIIAAFFIPFLLFLLWVLIVSIVLIRHRDGAAAGSPPPVSGS